MAEIILLTASPKRMSISKSAALSFLSYEYPGKSVKEINVNSLDITPCSACEGCVKTYRCINKDGTDQILEKITEAKTVIAASPVYFTGVPAPFKLLIDRAQPAYYKYEAGLKSKKKARGIIVLSMGGNKKKNMKPALAEIKSFFKVLGINCDTVITVSNTDAKK